MSYFLFDVVIKDVNQAKNTNAIRAIYIRYRLKPNEQHKYLKSGFKVAIKDFYNKNNQIVRPGTPNADIINNTITEKIENLSKQVEYSFAKGIDITQEFIENTWEGRMGGDIRKTLFSALEDWQHEKKLTDNSYDMYKTAINSFIKFCNYKGYRTISVTAINEYTKSSYFNHQYYTVLKFLFSDMEKKNVLTKGTMDLIFNIAKKPTSTKKEVVALTEYEINKYIELWRNFKGKEHERKVIGGFILQIETGMRYSDMDQLLDTEVKYSDAGFRYIEKHAKKRSKHFAVPLSPVAEEILNQYWKTGKIFDFFAHQKHHTSRLKSFHKILRKYTAVLGIAKNVTSHCARHTFITILSQKGCNTSNIQFMVAHSNSRMTEQYKGIDKSVAFKDFFESKSNTSTPSNAIYRKLVLALNNKIIQYNINLSQIDTILRNNSIYDNAQDYFSFKKNMGIPAYYLINKFIKSVGK